MLSPQGSLSLLIKFGLSKPAQTVLRRTQQNGGEISSFHRRCCFLQYVQLLFPKNSGKQNSRHRCFKAEHRCFEAKQRCFEAEYGCFGAVICNCFSPKIQGKTTADIAVLRQNTAVLGQNTAVPGQNSFKNKFHTS